MLPVTFMQIFKFPNFPSFPMFVSPPSPSLHVNYRVQEPHVSHTGINVYAHCPLHLPKIVTEKPSVNHIGSSTSHQKWYPNSANWYPKPKTRTSVLAKIWWNGAYHRFSRNGWRHCTSMPKETICDVNGGNGI